MPVKLSVNHRPRDSVWNTNSQGRECLLIGCGTSAAAWVLPQYTYTGESSRVTQINKKNVCCPQCVYFVVQPCVRSVGVNQQENLNTMFWLKADDTTQRFMPHLNVWTRQAKHFVCCCSLLRTTNGGVQSDAKPKPVVPSTCRETPAKSPSST